MFIDMWYQLTDCPWQSSSRYPNEYTAYEWVDPNDPDEGYAFCMGVLHGPQPVDELAGLSADEYERAITPV